MLSDGQGGNLPPEAHFNLPVQLRRRGLERRLILPSGDPSPAPNESLARLRHALGQALAWHQALVRGEVASMTALIETERLDPRNFARRLQLAYLAPDIIQAVIEGTIPPECTMERLKSGVPMDWAARRRKLGFTPLTG